MNTQTHCPNLHLLALVQMAFCVVSDHQVLELSQSMSEILATCESHGICGGFDDDMASHLQLARPLKLWVLTQMMKRRKMNHVYHEMDPDDLQHLQLVLDRTSLNDYVCLFGEKIESFFLVLQALVCS